MDFSSMMGGMDGVDRMGGDDDDDKLATTVGLGAALAPCLGCSCTHFGLYVMV